jgi:DNA mismatch endonuclease, patch repair protein
MGQQKPPSRRPARLRPRRQRAPLTRSQMMARIRSTDTAPEVRVRSALHALGVRFRKHVDALPGKPDLANRRNAWAVFVHGCFWHSHKGCGLASSPRSNSSYWRPKLMRNAERDRASARELRRAGFRVFVIWECETRAPARLSMIVRRLARKLTAATGRPSSRAG